MMALGKRGMGDKSSAFQGCRATLSAKSMISSENVGLKPTWKWNVCLLLLIAVIVSASIFAFITK